MMYYWLVITCSWLGGVSLQFVNPADTGSDGAIGGVNFGMNYRPLPYKSYFNDLELVDDIPVTNLKTQFHSDENQTDDLKRNRRMVESDVKKSTEVWQQHLPELDKTAYATDDEGEDIGPVIQNIPNVGEENVRDIDVINDMDKRNFSPWGGKRDNTNTNIEHLWTWKRAANVREPSMPKRVRFSPWGGKRSGQIVYKTGTKGSKIIFSTTVPELTRLVTNYSPNGKRLDLRGFQIVPSMDKRHPIKILAVTTRLDEQALREALPYKSFIEGIPRGYKPGHPYSDISLKSDGKRKVKFSAWGGKRSPPIIGPIWTPAPQDLKESTLNAILVIRNNPDQAQLITDPEQL